MNAAILCSLEACFTRFNVTCPVFETNDWLNLSQSEPYNNQTVTALVTIPATEIARHRHI